jgi:hypothetical protein
MKATRRFVTVTFAAGIAAAACVWMILPAYAQSLSPAEARQVAEDAYIYG